MGTPTPGVQNVVVDVLSRNPIGNMDGSQISCAALRALALNYREQLIREQREDPELGHIYRYLENPDDGSVNATVCEGPYPASRPERYRFILVITNHFTKWSELIPLRKALTQAIANVLFENYISRYGAPISLISDKGPQFISAVFEHLSHRLEIKHIKKVTYRPQANLTERVDRTLVQMIACFVEENHDKWDQFLYEFSFALRTSVNETTGKTPAELFLARKIITPFRKLINVTDGAEYVGGNIEKLFDEARQNMRKQHKTLGKYYNRKRREANIKVNDLVLVRTHFISAAGKRSSNGSSRLHPGKSKSSRKTSSDESKGRKSNKGTAGLEDLRLKRKVRSNGSVKRTDKKRSKICRKRSLQGSEHRDQKRPTPVPPQGIKRTVPSSVTSKTHKYRRQEFNSSQGTKSIAGP
ncbi:retrovirus-related Pol polyprotein from transposon 297 [Trichonephila clavipes]|nr:retrovirus-related Pol polyprotein from transposon 297 [Trichonephila clavipes]